ncbi:hypothetical protein TraAM80_04220 [Trypanosoma rangeli]|uniref:Transcription elongation factor-like protein n=1 Tax=Trypanosoma rangeli TaxID=5698 RepID=A0A422NKE1_TRYRA|nr:uncharacterized protein TraAM80_04220 [Trypanosoma rangeli]RNF05921.1 hypothetical protein TraAM80_04220 [Trypanosoma rangeli]|eukprot:RNF05921.1 hypothetical protein TraAM80_04220 [Trypanosoma rangeli]
MAFPLNTLVWLKQPEYPWWPGMVLDPAALEMVVPAGYDTCVLCLPSASSSVAFTNSSNTEELIRFNPATDAELLEAGKESSECAAAIEEALSVYRQQTQGKEEEEGRGAAEHRDGERKGRHVRKGDAPRRAAKHENKRHKRRERNESPPVERRIRHENKKSDKRKYKEHNNAESDTMEDLIESDYDRKCSKSTKNKLGEMGTLGTVDQYDKESRYVPTHQEEDAVYLEHMLRERRQAASDTTLQIIRNKLEALAVACNHGGVISVSEAAEEALLDALSPLSLVSITLDQLHRLKIGVVVGKFLMKDYPVRVVSLASAILTYWFRQLPPATQQRLSTQSALELASNETTIGSECQGLSLGALGVQLEACFTDEEVYDTINEPVVVARGIETELEALGDEDVSKEVLTALRDSQNTALRRGLLDGSVTAKELVANPGNPNALLRDPDAFSPSMSGRSPVEPESPLADGHDFTNFTTLYVCPECGAREAIANEYSVQAHDNMAVFVRCLKCGETWNVET